MLTGETAYDPAGRLYESSAAGTATRFLYDGATLIGETDASGSLLRRFVPGPGVDETLVWYEGAGTSDRRWLLQDRMGSTIGAADAAGASLATYSYDEVGRPGAWSGARLRYTGAMMLPEAQLYHLRARAYSPALGRFLQTDPVLQNGGMNLYEYVGDDPVNASDPSGLQDCPSRGPYPVDCGMPVVVTPVDVSRRHDYRSMWGAGSGIIGGGQTGAYFHIRTQLAPVRVREQSPDESASDPGHWQCLARLDDAAIDVWNDSRLMIAGGAGVLGGGILIAVAPEAPWPGMFLGGPSLGLVRSSQLHREDAMAVLSAHGLGSYGESISRAAAVDLLLTIASPMSPRMQLPLPSQLEYPALCTPK